MNQENYRKGVEPTFMYLSQVSVYLIHLTGIMYELCLFSRLMLLQEKEQLLRELKGINPKGRSQVEMKGIQTRISQLEYDLNVAVEISNKQIADRCV